MEITPMIPTIKNHYLTTEWKSLYEDEKIVVPKTFFHESWEKVLLPLFEDIKFEKIEKRLCDDVMTGLETEVYPRPNYIFRCFNSTPLSDLKVVILGQDPYYTSQKIGDEDIPFATGLSFSVPLGMTIPPSLLNIYDNLIKFGHMEKRPNHGCLDFWAYQGCLMLNTALTVVKGTGNSHSFVWKWFTDSIIKYISDNCDNVVFILWGGEAFKKAYAIDQDKHELVITSHPSPLSFSKQLRDYPPFISYDVFGHVNKCLARWKKDEIIWQV